jgi:hypothetical protein
VIVHAFPGAVETVVVWNRDGKRRASGSGIETTGRGLSCRVALHSELDTREK